MPNFPGMSGYDYQSYLKTKGMYTATVDGIEGANTQKSTRDLLNLVKDQVEASVMTTATYSVKRLAVNQFRFKELGFYTGKIDGRMGPSTQYAVEQYQNWTRNNDVVPIPSKITQWPTYSEIESFYGAPGTNHITVNLPYPMKLAWATKTQITRTTINSRCADSFVRVLENVLQTYGIEEIQKLKLDYFGGTYNNRPMRGGSKLSTHAYAAAMDIDPERNSLRADSTTASMAKPAYNKWWDCWEAEGWISLGRAKNFDWMHVQAVRL
jgi:peptidoglycan hydrolase-like protein with peptidoglycan-binding domain